MGIGKRQPDGKKIAELRKQRGLKQAGFAEAAGIRERLLRYIERTNRPVPATTITNLATQLGVSAPEITLPTPDEAPNASATLLRLRTVRSATELNSLAYNAHHYEWKLKVGPTVATAEDMRQLMTIVDRLVLVSRRRWQPGSGDEFDALPFGEISRLARLQELLEKLHAAGVGVLTGSYVQQSVINKEDASYEDTIHRIPGNEIEVMKTEVVIYVHFVPSEVEEEVITINECPF